MLGAVLWIAFLNSGIHPTIAGVLHALVVPVRTPINASMYFDKVTHFLKKFKAGGTTPESIFATRDQRAALDAIEKATVQVQSPLQRLESAIHPWVTFFIMPVFALANAGVHLGGDLGAIFQTPLFYAVMLGLFIGKQAGIFLFTWALIKSKIVKMPASLSWRQIYGAACLAGIGFTMAIFITELSMENAELISVAKLGILCGSLLSGILGYLVLSTGKRQVNTESAPQH